MRRFARAAVFDWSGQAVERPAGIRLATARTDRPPVLERPAHRWSRADALDWIAARADEDLLIGLDLGAALPFADAGAYFPGHPGSPADARALWAFVEALCAGDPHLGAGSFVAHPALAPYFRHRGLCGAHYGARGGGRLRVAEAESARQGLANPTSNFNLVGAAQVGKSSLTGMRVLHRLCGRVPVWPFDPLPARGAVVVEIYTSIAAVMAGLPRGRAKMRNAETLDGALAGLGLPPAAPLDRYDDHATDALLTAAWLLQASAESGLWHPAGMTPALAATEGWTFGVA